MKTPAQMQGSTMVFAAIFVALFTLTVGSYLTVISSGSVGTAGIANQEKAYYAAEAGAYRLLNEMNTTGATSVSGALPPTTYTGNYTATFDNVDTVTSVGTVSNMTQTVTVKVYNIPSSVRAAVTVNSNASTLGNITLDGRTYDSNGVVVSQSGAVGISAAGKVTQGGSSQIGGNGYAPASPANPAALEQNVQPFPSTAPWDVLGVPQSWFNLNVPLRKGLPPAGFNGVWYTKTPPSGSADLDKVQGILIVHDSAGGDENHEHEGEEQHNSGNSGNSATLKNVHGTFKGLIITDAIDHINGDAKIYGALVVTGQNGNALGNGNALVAYSPQILSSLGVLVDGNTGQWKKSVQGGTWQGATSASSGGQTGPCGSSPGSGSPSGHSCGSPCGRR